MGTIKITYMSEKFKEWLADVGKTDMAIPTGYISRRIKCICGKMCMVLIYDDPQNEQSYELLSVRCPKCTKRRLRNIEKCKKLLEE